MILKIGNLKFTVHAKRKIQILHIIKYERIKFKSICFELMNYSSFLNYYMLKFNFPYV